MLLSIKVIESSVEYIELSIDASNFEKISFIELNMF